MVITSAPQWEMFQMMIFAKENTQRAMKSRSPTRTLSRISLKEYSGLHAKSGILKSQPFRFCKSFSQCLILSCTVEIKTDMVKQNGRVICMYVCMFIDCNFHFKRLHTYIIRLSLTKEYNIRRCKG